MRVRLIGLSLVLVAGIIGCGVFTDEEVCTLRGCYSGLYIEMEELPRSPVHLSVRLPDGSVLERECLPELCVLGTLFEGVSAPSVEITVTINGRAETFTAQLVYEEFYPNGEDCGNPCLVTAVYLKSLNDRLVAA